jgi:hypothetical protein
MKLTSTLTSICVVAALSPPVSAAQIINGNFETLNLSGWYSSSTTAIANGVAGYAPLQGAASALIVAMSTAPIPPYTCQNDVWNVSCTLPLPFAASGAPLPTYTNYSPSPGVAFAFLRGGFIGQDVVATQGDKLTWNWLLAGDSIDEGRFYATNGSTQVAIDYSLNISTFTFPSSGLWSIYFGLYQREDPYIYSVLKLDSVAIQAVPDLSSTIAMLLGITCLAVRKQSMPLRHEA